MRKFSQLKTQSQAVYIMIKKQSHIIFKHMV